MSSLQMSGLHPSLRAASRFVLPPRVDHGEVPSLDESLDVPPELRGPLGHKYRMVTVRPQETKELLEEIRVGRERPVEVQREG